jgi:hypothetical protein
VEGGEEVSEIPAHWEDVSSKDRPGTAFRRSDGRCRIELGCAGRFKVAVPGHAFPLENEEGDTLAQFMAKVDDLDTPRIPRRPFDIPRKEELPTISTLQVVCVNKTCHWRNKCVCHMTADERTLYPDLQSKLLTPKQPEIATVCVSFKKGE